VPDEIARGFVSLAEGMPDETVRPLLNRGAPDTILWDGYITPYLGKTWLELPWFFAEMYFYRRMLEASGYYQPGWGECRDPYTHAKCQGVEASLESTLQISNFVAGLKQADRSDHRSPVQKLMLASLWGNQADLSMWAAGEGPVNAKAGRESKTPSQMTPSQSTAPQPGSLIVDHSKRASEIIAAGLRRVDIVLDNSGPELMADLVLVNYLISSGLVEQVVLHAKVHPTFVSDATRTDVTGSIEFLMNSQHPVLQELGSRLEQEMTEGHLLVTSGKDNFYWHSPDPFWDLPRALEAELMKSDLLIFKGDANFRRLLGDRHWQHTTPFDAIVELQSKPRSCSNPPLLALRVCKSEVACGLDEGESEELFNNDPKWMTDGHWGMAILAEKNQVTGDR